MSNENQIKFPSIVNGQNQNMVQKHNNQSIYTIGTTQTANAGALQNFNQDLGGRARWLYGIVITVPQANINDQDQFNLNINQEQVCQDTPMQSFLPQVNIFKEKQFYYIGRYLTGNDKVQIGLLLQNTHFVGVTYYLSDVPPVK